MPSTYLPSRESELVTWSNNFSALVQADAAAYGLNEGQTDAYSDAQIAFVDAYQVANDPTTRSPKNIETKNLAKQALVALTRELVKVCQAWPAMTNDKRVALGITVPDVDPTPVPVPEFAPQLDVVGVSGRTFSLRLRDSVTGERKKPEGVQGATVVSYVGETIPADMRQWHFEGITTRTNVDVEFGATVPMGAKVWLAAFWYNRRAESGPACAPLSAHVGFGAMTEGASEAA